jgi:hypothetical protein
MDVSAAQQYYGVRMQAAGAAMTDVSWAQRGDPVRHEATPNFWSDMY